MSKYLIMRAVVVGGGKCKATLFLRKHKCVETKGAGWRCKYCGIPLIRLREQNRGEFRSDKEWQYLKY